MININSRKEELLLKLSNSSKFGFLEKVGCSFLTMGLLIIMVFHIALPGLVPYIDLFAYLFLIAAVLLLKSHSKLFMYTLLIVLVNLILVSSTYILFHNNVDIVSNYAWILYLARILDFGILFIVCASINHYACQVNNCELSERCIYNNKLFIFLAVVIALYTFRDNIIRMMHVKGNGATFLSGSALLAFIMMPTYVFIQITGLIGAFKESLRLRSYIDFK